MGNATIGKIIRQVCIVIWNKLQSSEMPVPSTQDWLNISTGFYTRSNFPNCVGAIDGKHIRLNSPKLSGSLYYNYKGYSSIVLLAVCDANYCFTIIDVGSYGKEGDSNIFKYSAFGKKVISESINFPPNNYLPGDESGNPLPFFLIGDEAFPLRTNLLRPFPGRSLNKERKIFNYRLSRARRNVECSFGILANKWRVFHTPLLVNPNFATDIIKASCILHNFVRRRDGVNFEDTLSCPLESVTFERARNSTSEAKSVRDYLVTYVNHKNMLSWTT